MNSTSEKLENPRIGDPPEIDISRCIRYRWNQSSCDSCMQNCTWDAIELSSGQARINEDRCTSCMKCVGACNSGAIEDRTSLLDRIVGELEGLESPVIGCRREPTVSAHTRITCLGQLTGQMLLAFGLALGKSVQLNATHCAGCPNGSIVDGLFSDVARIAKLFPNKTPFDVSIVVDKSDLRYEHSRIDRRAFFGQIRESIASLPRTVVESLEGSHSLAYGTKTLPCIRTSLNASYDTMDRTSARRLLESQYFDAEITSECDCCGLCLGMCPTAALVRDRSAASKAGEILFNTMLCTGCGLCSEACPKAAISIRSGDPVMNDRCMRAAR